MRKSQLYGQIFIYVLTILFISFILAFGYNAVHNFKIRAEQVACLKFSNDLQGAIESISSEYGSVKRKDLQLCGGYKYVCFVESYESFVTSSPTFKYINYDKPPSDDPIIKDSIKDGTGKNVFLIEDIEKESFYAGKISVDKDVLCIKAVNNKISLRLEGKGDHVALSQWV